MQGNSSCFAHVYLPKENKDRAMLALIFNPEKNTFEDERGNSCRFQPWPASREQNFNADQIPTNRDEFIASIAKGKEDMGNGSLAKIVLSRLAHLPRRKPPEEIFETLASEHTSAFVYHIRHPQMGEWIGATPEVLFHFEAGQFEAMALAGTQPINNKKDWSPKLYQEHEYVVKNFTDAFKLMGIRNWIQDGPYEKPAGTIVHLATHFKFSSEAPEQNWCNLLHPTSAICGEPRTLAQKWISDNELHDRRLYTGLITLQHPDKVSHYINLRCAQVFHDHLEIYAGVGLTKYSDPHDEWLETERKLDTITHAAR